MKKILILTGLTLWMVFNVNAQIADPVKWTFSHESIGDQEVELVFKAIIDPPWHLYSAYLPSGGPIATKPYFNESEAYSLVDGIVEVTKPKKKFDEGFQMELGTISGKAELRQRVKLNGPGTHTITGEIEFQVCDDVICLPPKYEEFSFTVTLPGDGGAATSAQIEETTETLSTETESKLTVPGVPAMEDERSLWGFFWLAFGLGLLALLTPCVFPMIPMTVSFFMQGNGSKAKGFLRGLVFGLSIVAIYTSLGVIVSISNVGPNAANALSTHWIPNLIFFALFVLFAFSFFGMFELVLPSRWVNKADSRADKGGFGGAFFMALTTVLVSFSCTGPIVGALLVEAAGGLALKPILGMFGFALAFAIPFTLFAIFPSWLKGLPKSGGWLNAVKVVLGFLVLAFSMKFLLALDPANKILTRELYLAVWIVLFFMLGIYFLGKLRFSHDSDLSHVTVPRLLLSVASFTFVVYLFMGLFGYELKNIAPLLPPKSPNGIDLTQRAVYSGAPVAATTDQEGCAPTKYTDLFHMPFGLKGFYDLEEGLACAEASGKPVLIDFKGHFCSNCKKMEAAVWSDPEVLNMLRNDFVIVALYTDDRTKLPESEWYTSDVDGKIKKTIGQQNIDFEIGHFQTNTIPLYVIMDAEGNVVNPPKGTDLDVQSYLSWLKEGKVKS
ncbi:MAG: thioredoxin family protein [Bacteroidales bacterium]|nr:thioredoxin family protein [Bacteroidales bacterium]